MPTLTPESTPISGQFHGVFGLGTTKWTGGDRLPHYPFLNFEVCDLWGISRYSRYWRNSQNARFLYCRPFFIDHVICIETGWSSAICWVRLLSKCLCSEANVFRGVIMQCCSLMQKQRFLCTCVSGGCISHQSLTRSLTRCSNERRGSPSEGLGASFPVSIKSLYIH